MLPDTAAWTATSPDPLTAVTPAEPTSASEREPERTGRAGTSLVWLLSFLALTAVASLWAVGVPAGGQPDEPAHLQKAAAVVRGQFTWLSRQERVATVPGEVNWTQMRLRVPRSYEQLGPATACAIRPPPEPQSCTDGLTDDDAPVEVDDYVAAYPPLPYIAVGWPSFVLPLAQAVVASRLSMAVLCASFLALAFVSARRVDRAGFFTLGIVFAITPGVLFFTSTSNPNGLEMATAICLAAASVELFVSAGRVQTDGTFASLTAPIVSTALSASVLVLTRPVSLGVVVVVMGSIALTLSSRAAWRAIWRAPAGRVGVVSVVVAAMLAASWVIFARPLDTVIGIQQPPLRRVDAITESVERFPQRVQEFIGVFGWGDTLAPTWVLWFWTLALIALVVGALVVGSWRHRAGLGALVVINLLIPTISEVPRAQELGFIWSGRYSAPFAVAIPILAGWIMGVHIRPARRTVRAIAIATSAVVGAAMFVAPLMTLTRFATGSTSPSVFGFVHEQSWQPHGGPMVYVIGATAAALGYAAVIVWLVSTAAQDTRSIRFDPRRSPSRSTG